MGMVADFLGYTLLHRWKWAIEHAAYKKLKAGDLSSQELHARLVIHAPGLANQLEIRSTRDRIARGSAVARGTLFASRQPLQTRPGPLCETLAVDADIPPGAGA